MVFVVDDLVGWLITRLADAGYQKLTTLLRGSDQARALKQAVTAAVQATVGELGPSDGEEADRVAEQINKAFRRRDPVPLPPGQPTMLEALQAGIAAELAVLDGPGLTGTGQSAAEQLGVSGSVLAEALAGHLVQEIMLRGSGGGPLFPLSSQLNDDVTHLQGQRIERALAQLADRVRALAHARAPVVPGKPVRLAPRPAFLAGREDLLAGLDARLASGDGSGPQIVALAGLGGAGKTSVAVEYAHRHLDQVGVAWQFPAEDTTVLAAGFTELAAQLGFAAAAGGGDPVASVHSVLAAYPAGWLLVFDNAADQASVAPFVPPAGAGRVLITSRNALWPPRQLVEVPVLGTGVAAGFLAERTGDPDRQAAAALAGELGGLPLALEQAAAYIQATAGSLAGYLASFREHQDQLLARGEPTGYDKTVATTWSLALHRLEESAPSAAGLLRLLACLAPEPVPLTVLLADAQVADKLAPGVAATVKPLLGNPIARGDAVAALRRYSLITPAGDGLVLVHRLVQKVTRGELPAEMAGRWKQAAEALVNAAVPDTELPAAWPVCALLLPHARAVLDLTSDGMWRIAQYLGFSGNYPAARDLFRQIGDARQEDDAYGAEHPGTLAARHNSARWAGAAGDAAGARDQFAALLPIRERILGAEHPDTLTTRVDLAFCTGAAGDPAGARDQFAALLPVRERILGAEHPDTLAVRLELARWTGAAGDPAAARDQFAALLPIIERVIGAEHPGTLTTRGNLANWTGEAGDAAGARDQFAALLPIRERVLGAEHPETMNDRTDLAHWTREAADGDTGVN